MKCGGQSGLKNGADLLALHARSKFRVGNTSYPVYDT